MLVSVPKKNGTLHFCVDYRRLNAVTVKNSHSVQRMDEWIDSLGNAVISTTLDCNSGSWQIETAKRNRNKSIFTSQFCLFRFKPMPFELQSAPSIFELAVDTIPLRVKWKTLLVYLDDVTISFKTVTEQMTHDRENLQLLQAAGVTAKFENYILFDTAVCCLGQIIRPTSVRDR